ncbi:hypothetical protein LSH36_202g04000 [Paralvinella palmiformis]|uniref:Transporter n=1 Tax=Paralvinella palmiformis TaxID=53620 RepID=A0AAD9JPB2_9ANNE|nr:hypothetical protein LSH36_202g04000 [Paralvinella palmiformis]
MPPTQNADERDYVSVTTDTEQPTEHSENGMPLSAEDVKGTILSENDADVENGIPSTHGSIKKQNHERGNWTNKLDFIMSALSFAVGMGNIWRFPYICYKNGGGIGWTMFLVSFISCIYYNMLVVYSFFYLFASFAKDIPWRGCDNSWNTPACGGIFAMRNCSLHNGTWYNNTCYGLFGDVPAEGQKVLESSAKSNTSHYLLELKPKSPADEYFHHYMLAISDGLEFIGAPRWQLVLILLMCWSIVAICLSKGIRSFGKATYVTSVFPYIILVILLIRGLMLDGSTEGILYYLTPNFEKLLTAEVWGDAAIQVFFSMSICWGGLITLASYNKFDNNCLRDSFVVAIGDALTSIFAGVVIFAIIGYMSKELQVPIDEVATQGAGLAFIIYPSAVASLPISPLWSVLFMLMLINLGIGTQFTLVTTAHTTLLDAFSDTLRHGRRPLFLLLGMCAFCFLAGLSMTTKSGMYILQLMDSYAPSYSLLVIGVMETIAISWVYGHKRFFRDIEQMLGKKPNIFWMFCWKFVTPVLVTGILLFTFIDFTPSTYGSYQYPVWGEVIGWTITLFELAFIPGVAIYKVFTADSELSLIQRIRLLSKPASNWGPAHEIQGNIIDNSMVPLKELTSFQNQPNDEQISNGGVWTLSMPNGLEQNAEEHQNISSRVPSDKNTQVPQYHTCFRFTVNTVEEAMNDDTKPIILHVRDKWKIIILDK